MNNTERNTQLQINFAGNDNPVRENFRRGGFQVLVEYCVPRLEQPLASAFEVGMAIARLIRQHPLVAGMAITDRQQGEDCHDPVNAVSGLAAAAGKPMVLHLSGKGSGEIRLRDLIARATSAGVGNFIAVTGDRSDKHVKRSFAGRLKPYPAGYHDSIRTLHLLRRTGAGLCLGAAVNPFKYTPADIYLQYFKMMRKIAAGADFLVANCGWDMKKLQELQWYLNLRGCAVPVLARLPLLPHSAAKNLRFGLVPGVSVSKPMAALVERESSVNQAQWFAAQLPRLAMQAAGCRLLGYSGVQIVGLNDPLTADSVLDRIAAALQEYTDYDHWLDAWIRHHDNIEFNPLGSAGHYIFKSLLTKGRPLYDPETAVINACEFPKARPADLCRHAMVGFFDRIAPRGTAAAPAMGDRLFCGRCGGTCRDRAACYHLCARDCPKGLCLGPCGGSAADGTCEFGHAPCFFHRVLAIAAHRRELDFLEKDPENV